jgi:Colicin E5 ribonuclease domain
MSGNLARRRMAKFMPAEFKLTETRQPPLKDRYDEWLARVICYAFSVPASAFVTQVNRATSETLRTQAAQEGLVPLKAWVKMALDRVVQVCFRQPDLEFFWIGDDAVDPLQQAQTIAILVNAGVKTRDEARAELGLTEAPGIAKFNPFHDEQGRFTDTEHAVGPGNHSPPIVPVASTTLDTTPKGFKLGGKIRRQMGPRGWTGEQIDEAVQNGSRIDAINKGTGGPATRYVNPNTWLSVVIDNMTNEVLHVGEPGFEYGPGAVATCRAK